MEPLWGVVGTLLSAAISRATSGDSKGMQARHMALQQAAQSAQSPLQGGALAALGGRSGALCRAGCS